MMTQRIAYSANGGLRHTPMGNGTLEGGRLEGASTCCMQKWGDPSL